MRMQTPSYENTIYLAQHKITYFASARTQIGTHSRASTVEIRIENERWNDWRTNDSTTTHTLTLIHIPHSGEIQLYFFFFTIFSVVDDFFFFVFAFFFVSLLANLVAGKIIDSF